MTKCYTGGCPQPLRLTSACSRLARFVGADPHWTRWCCVGGTTTVKKQTCPWYLGYFLQPSVLLPVALEGGEFCGTTWGIPTRCSEGLLATLTFAFRQQSATNFLVKTKCSFGSPFMLRNSTRASLVTCVRQDPNKKWPSSTLVKPSMTGCWFLMMLSVTWNESVKS